MSASVMSQSVAPWTQSVTRVRGVNRRRVEIRFSPAYIRALWQPRTAPKGNMRGAFDDAINERLLYDGTIPVDGGSSMFVQAWLVPALRPEYYHIRVLMTAPGPLKKCLHVCLYWDNDQYTAKLARGEWLFEDITEPKYSRRNGNLPTRRLRMIFEFQDNDNRHAP